MFESEANCLKLRSVLKARSRFEECISSQQEWKQIHHLCYWELMWTHSFQQEWQQAYRYADLLCKESRWSKVRFSQREQTKIHSGSTVCVCLCVCGFQAIYMYQKAAILSMMTEDDVRKTGEDIVEIFRLIL